MHAALGKTSCAVNGGGGKVSGKTNKLAPGGTGKNSVWLGVRTSEVDKRYSKANRRNADKNSNLNNAPKKPEWATGTGTENMASGTSIFDPVLCELAYRWFCPQGGSVLDPFAGGSVRGIVASKCGLDYTGVDLRAEQIEANQKQADAICDNHKPKWIVGDSLGLETLVKGTFDLVFSCPPYGDLEQYSEDPRDISTMDLAAFLGAYRAIISACVAKLKPNRFAVFVVGDYRDAKGFYCNFPAETIAAFQSAGARLYNEAILVTSVGSLPIRITKQFQGGRKLGKTHQNVLVFFNGDPRKIKADFGECQFGEDAGPPPLSPSPGIDGPE